MLVAYNAPTDLTVNAAMIAQNMQCSGLSVSKLYQRKKIVLPVNGSLASYGLWTWTYVSGSNVISGFRNTYTNYDGNLLYSPPPSFPLSTDGYQQISWTSD